VSLSWQSATHHRDPNGTSDVGRNALQVHGPAAIFLAFRAELNGLYVDPVLPIEAQRDFPKNEDGNLNPGTDAEMRIARLIEKKRDAPLMRNRRSDLTFVAKRNRERRTSRE
jgi:hypothetical protein